MIQSRNLAGYGETGFAPGVHIPGVVKQVVMFSGVYFIRTLNPWVREVVRTYQDADGMPRAESDLVEFSPDDIKGAAHASTD